MISRRCSALGRHCFSGSWRISGRQQNVTHDRQPIEQNVALEDNAHVLGRRGDGFAVEHDRAGGRLFEAGNASQKRAFAASTGAKNADELCRADGKVHVLERDDAAAARRIDLFETGDA